MLCIWTHSHGCSFPVLTCVSIRPVYTPGDSVVPFFPSHFPTFALLTAIVASAPGIEAGPVVLKHPASEAEIQPQTQVTLRCHIDGHPR